MDDVCSMDLWCVAGVMALSSGVGPGSFIAILLAAACAYVTVMLHKVSKRPYWQIYKYELTGQREPKEKRYITIGNIIAGYMRWSVKLAFGMIRLIFSFI